MQGRVLWITGLSCAGKSTLAQALLPYFPQAILLDGDALRAVLGVENTAYDAQSRKELALTYARLAGLLAHQGHTVIVATISLFHAVHSWNREHLPQYKEIFLDVPEDIRRQRDLRGLYVAPPKGQLPSMAGQDVTVEFPLMPHVRFTHKDTLEHMVQTIVQDVK